MKKLLFLIVFFAITHFAYTQNPPLYLKFDKIADTTMGGGVWELEPLQTLNTFYYYDHYIYNQGPLTFYCRDKSIFRVENIPISQLPTTLVTVQQLSAQLLGATDEVQNTFWNTRGGFYIIEIDPNGQTFSRTSVHLRENEKINYRIKVEAEH